jgi:DNA-binding GntR family transcriptional regulator
MPEPTLHARIREAILTLDLAPGQRLSERGLEPEFGASRTPIRAALMRLEAEGLTRRDGKNWFVTPIDLDEVRGLYEFREVLESASVRLATERASDSDLAMLAGLARSPASAETPEHSVDGGTNFHLELARLSGNEFLRSAMEGVLTRLYRARWLEVRSAESRARAHREHEALSAALTDRDGAAAELAMLEHLRGTGIRLVESLQGARRSLRGHGIAVDGMALGPVMASPPRD